MKETTVLSTTDYGLFKEIISNREVDDLHVKHLVATIQETNLLHLNPIIVNSEMEVIDGQHRLAAAQQLSVPIYYFIDDKVTKQHIAGLNSNQKHWSMEDYVNFYCVEKNPHYLILSEFIRKHPFVGVWTLTKLLTSGGTTKDFREGRFEVDQKEEATAILQQVDKVRNIGLEFAYDRNFVMALKDARAVEGFNPDQFMQKLENNRMELFKCAKKQQYLQLIEAIYNKHQHYKLRLI